MVVLRPNNTSRSILKTLTTPMHKAAEAVHWSDDGFADLDRYRRFLTAMRSAHLALGLPAAQCRSDMESMAREQVLIACLSTDLDGNTARTDAACRDGMRIGFAWGVTYALSGSALGAGMILASGTLGQDWPRRYLTAQHGFASSGGVRRVFEALNAAEPDIDDALKGARAVFDMAAAAAPDSFAAPLKPDGEAA